MIMTVLKERTKAIHDRVEKKLNLSRGLASFADYSQLLSQFHGLYSPLESRIAAGIRNTVDGFRFSNRLKRPLLEDDLSLLGWSSTAIAAIPICPSIPSIGKASHAWGALYVLEGATLGGQIIQREVFGQLGLTAERGCTFFSCYRDRTIAMWREFGDALTRFVKTHPGSEGEIVCAASATFQSIEDWL